MIAVRHRRRNVISTMARSIGRVLDRISLGIVVVTLLISVSVIHGTDAWSMIPRSKMMKPLRRLSEKVMIGGPSSSFGTLERKRRSLKKDSVFLSSTRNDDSNGDDGLLDELDARVLQSMLQDEKLNLQQEQNMKRLLERGIRSNEPVAQEAKRAKEEAMEEKQYASQVLQTLGNTKLWKGLQRNAADFFESARIWVENKVERDTKLVAGLGFFAFERALQDVKRALPATTTFVNKVAPKRFLLDSTSSAKDQQQDIRSQMLTPQDEIKSVTQEIKSIIQSGGGQRSCGSSQRGLQSTASSRQGKDRFLKAYQRRKQTTLKREQENIAQSSMRMAGSVLDSAYQVQRELEIEPNQPGYKTKALREGAVQTSKFLAAGAAGFLSGAKAVAQAALTDGSKTNPPGPPASLPSTTNQDIDGGMDATNQALDAAMRRMSPQQPGMGGGGFIDATVVDVSPMETSSSPWTAANAPINSRIPGTSSGFLGTPIRTDASSRSAPTTPTYRSDSEEENLFFASRQAPDYQQTLPDLEEDISVESILEGSEVFFASQAFPFEPQIVEAIWEVQTGSGGAGGGIPPTNDIYADGVVVFDNDVDDDDFVFDVDPQDALRNVMAEIISDDEFEDAFVQAKQVNEVTEFEEENQTPSIWTKITLRALDVVFLVLEKIIFVRIFVCWVCFGGEGGCFFFLQRFSSLLTHIY